MDSPAKRVARTKPGKVEMAAAEPAPLLGEASNGDPNLSRRSSFGQRLLEAGQRHLRKTLSGQRMMDSEEGATSASLSRAASNASLSHSSSASLSFSYSFTGFTALPADTAPDNRVVSDDDENGIDLEAGDARKNLVSQPTFPICLKFTDVRYSVLVKGITNSSEKQILKGITGSARPGELLALMGPSGSGKTTLLSLLGGRITGNITRGSITYNGEQYTKSLKRRIGFVTQDDVLYTHLTVKETLTYAALLRLPRTMSRQQMDERAMSIIYELGLERCKDTVIGGAFVRGVSGGERKRVCIGIEIIINPSLLFLDEPTSGLDSTTALRIIKVLQGIAKSGKNVVTTIHQPSSRLFHRFDKLILLGKGSMLYYGKASKAMDYFASIGCSPLIAMNPAEFLLDVSNGNLSDVTTPSKLEDKLQAENLGNNTRNGKPSPEDVQEYLVETYEIRAADKQKKKLEAPAPISEDLKVTTSSPGGDWGASWWQQYSILFWRGLRERRHDYLSWMRITQVLAISAITSLLWWHSSSSPVREDKAGLLFFISVFWGFFPVFTAIFTFPQERQMLNKERAVDMYKLSAYFMATTTSDFPLHLILPLLFLLLVYFMTGLRHTIAHFILTMLILFLDIVAAQGLGLAISASVMDIKKSTTLGSVITMTFMLSGGFFVQRVPAFIVWLRYVSFNYHAYRLLLKVQYDDDLPPSLKVGHIGNGLKEVTALLAMVFAYRFLAYISLRRMKLPN